MIRLYVIGEGETEEAIVKRVLVPHLSAHNVFPYPQSQGGGRQWSKWRRFLDRLMRQERASECRFTTIFDLYAFPSDLRDMDSMRDERDTHRRAAMIEAAMAADLPDARFIPYVQRHEIEALVLTGLEELAAILPHERAGLERLRIELAEQDPEDVNDNYETVPSRRLKQRAPTYSKTVDGPSVIERVGLSRIRAACPRFGEWLTRLENLGA